MDYMTDGNEQTALDYDPYDDMVHEVPILVQYWHAVLRQKIAIAAILVACAALGIVITLLMTPYFTSTSRIEISREQDKVTNVEGLNSSDGGLRNLEFYQTQYSLLESRSLSERVARSENLASDEDFFDAFGVDPSNSGIFSETPKQQTAAQRSDRLTLATNLLQGHVTITPIRGSSLVDVSFASPNPALSAKIANAWVEQFVASNLDRRFNSTADAREFLE